MQPQRLSSRFLQNLQCLPLIITKKSQIWVTNSKNISIPDVFSFSYLACQDAWDPLSAFAKFGLWKQDGGSGEPRIHAVLLFWISPINIHFHIKYVGLKTKATSMWYWSAEHYITNLLIDYVHLCSITFVCVLLCRVMLESLFWRIKCNKPHWHCVSNWRV